MPPDQGARDHSYNPVTKHLTSTLDKTRDQAWDSSRDIMWLIVHLTSQVPNLVTILWHMIQLTIYSLTDYVLCWWHA